MKIRHSLSSLLKALFGYTGRINIEPTPEQDIVDEAWEQYYRHFSGGGYEIQSMDHPFRLTEKVTIELLYGNYKSSQMLRVAIERFNINSTLLGKRMLILSVIMSILVFVQVCIMIIVN